MTAADNRDADSPDSLIENCPVDWRGDRLGDALNELSQRLHVRYLLDQDVGREYLDARVRLRAMHLNGAEAFRWLARLGGLEAVWTEGLFLVARPEQVPIAWRIGLQSASLGNAPHAGQNRWNEVLRIRSDIQWVDTPLSAVSRELGVAYGIDLVFSETLISDQLLVTIRLESAGLIEIVAELVAALNASASVQDGAIWIRPGPSDIVPDWNRLQAIERGTERAGEAATGKGLDTPVTLDDSVSDWPSFVNRLSEAAGTHFSGPEDKLSTYPRILAHAPVRDVLEAGRLLRKLRWEPAPGGGGAVIRLDIEGVDEPAGELPESP